MSFKVGLFIQFIQSWKQMQFVYSVCLGIKKSEMSSPELHSAPLRLKSMIDKVLLSWVLLL